VLDAVVAELTPFYGPECPVAIVWRASWPDELVIRGTLGTISVLVQATKIERTALILAGPVLGARGFQDSALYDPEYQRRFRPARNLSREQ
jgi:precorrin-4/cobalt-precorrin-4 C11-methyltransferase